MDQKDQLQMVITAVEKCRKEVEDGKRIATVDELIFGLPFWKSDPHRDAQTWVTENTGSAGQAFWMADSSDHLERQLIAFSRELTVSKADAARDTVIELLHECDEFDRQTMLRSIAARLDIYASELGDREAATRMAALCMSRATYRAERRGTGQRCLLHGYLSERHCE